MFHTCGKTVRVDNCEDRFVCFLIYFMFLLDIISEADYESMTKSGQKYCVPCMWVWIPTISREKQKSPRWAISCLKLLWNLRIAVTQDFWGVGSCCLLAPSLWIGQNYYSAAWILLVFAWTVAGFLSLRINSVLVPCWSYRVPFRTLSSTIPPTTCQEHPPVVTTNSVSSICWMSPERGWGQKLSGWQPPDCGAGISSNVRL